MHGCCDGDVGDGDFVACQPLRLGQLGVQDPSELVPSGRLGIDDGLVRFGFEQRFDDEFDEIDIAALEPDRCLPQQPAIDVGALFQVLGVGGAVSSVGMVGRILQNRIRFGNRAMSICNCGRDGGTGIDLSILLALVLAGEVIDVVEVEVGAQQIQAG